MVEEVGTEYDDLNTDTSFLSALAPKKKSVDFGKALEPDDDQGRLQWSLILDLI